MSFLTKFPINKRRRGAQKLLGSPQAMHAAVLAGYPPNANEGSGRVLWRVEELGHDTSLLVLSPGRPDFTALVEQAGWPVSEVEPWMTREYAGLLQRLENGTTWRFRLRANPVRQAPDGRGKVAHVTAAQQQDWLVRRTADLGFSIVGAEAGAGSEPQVVVSDRRIVKFRRGDGTVTLSTALFDGVLTVNDAEVFRSTLLSGVGRAKGYGCGLLTVTGYQPQ